MKGEMTNSTNNGERVSSADDEILDDLRDAFAIVVSCIKDDKMKKRYADIIDLYRLTKDPDEVPSIGVYGCPKMGKSTLLNSLLGDKVLPMGPVPSTSMVINIYRCPNRRDYEINCYEPNKISEEKRGSIGVKEWENMRRGSKSQRHFPDIKGVHAFLEEYASHKGKRRRDLAEIEVRGPFVNADDRLRRFVLRDTPGAEAVAENANNEELRQDTKLAQQSIGRTNIHIFCISCETLAGSHDKAFYDEFFRERSCIHVLTRRDMIDEGESDDDKLKDDFSKNFGMEEWDGDVIKEIVLTGKRDINDDFITRGKDELVNAICKHHDSDSLCIRMAQIARSLLDERVRHPDWSPIKDIPEIYFVNLQVAVDKFMKQVVR